jgi:hypothetical protein
MFLIAKTIACAESTVRRHVTREELIPENQLWWIMFICFTIVDFPDSPEPQNLVSLCNGTSGSLTSSTAWRRE